MATPDASTVSLDLPFIPTQKYPAVSINITHFHNSEVHFYMTIFQFKCSGFNVQCLNVKAGHAIYARRACNLCKKDIQIVQEGHTICARRTYNLCKMGMQFVQEGHAIV